MADQAKGIPIAREGVPFVMGAAVPAILAGLLGCKKVSLALGAVACFTGWFFRNPPRTIPRGDELILVQVAGLIARRIVCEIKENDETIQGDRFGMIRFGSRVDLYFENYKLLVRENQKTIAGETLIAKKS